MIINFIFSPIKRSVCILYFPFQEKGNKKSLFVSPFVFPFFFVLSFSSHPLLSRMYVYSCVLLIKKQARNQEKASNEDTAPEFLF